MTQVLLLLGSALLVGTAALLIWLKSIISTCWVQSNLVKSSRLVCEKTMKITVNWSRMLVI
jgi:hypothetical protein